MAWTPRHKWQDSHQHPQNTISSPNDSKELDLHGPPEKATAKFHGSKCFGTYTPRVVLTGALFSQRGRGVEHDPCPSDLPRRCKAPFRSACISPPPPPVLFAFPSSRVPTTPPAPSSLHQVFEKMARGVGVRILSVEERLWGEGGGGEGRLSSGGGGGGIKSSRAEAFTRATNAIRSQLVFGECNPVPRAPGGSLCYCTCAQEAISTKSAGRKWLVSGLKDHRYPPPPHSLQHLEA